MSRTKTLALAMLVTLAAVAALPAGAAGRAPNLTGSWLVEIAIENPPPGIPPVVYSLRSYAIDGTMVESGSGADRSTGHGEWIRLGNRRFRLDWAFFIFTPDGTPLLVKETTHLTVNASGDEYRGDGVGFLFTTGGAPAGGPIPFTETATRLRFD
jgi:hypothetical protein